MITMVLTKKKKNNNAGIKMNEGKKYNRVVQNCSRCNL